MQAPKTYFRHRVSGKVVSLPVSYNKPTHPFYSTYELLGDEYEDQKVVVEQSPEDTRPAGNAAREVWAEYAGILGHNVPDDMNRTEIIALVDGADDNGED